MILGYDWGYVIGFVLLLVGIGFAILAVVLIVKGRKPTAALMSDYCARDHDWVRHRGHWVRHSGRGSDYLRCRDCPMSMHVETQEAAFQQAWRLAPWA